jgi:hypothetical protein
MSSENKNSIKQQARIAFFLRSATGNLVDLKRQSKILVKELARRGISPEACVIEVYRDAHHSGLRHGPEFERMCRDIKAGKIDLVMVERMNRVSRSLAGLMAFQDFVSAQAVRFISAHENVDSIYWQKPAPPKNTRESETLTPKADGLSDTIRSSHVHT